MNKLLRAVYVLIFSAVCSLCHADNSVIFQLVTDVSQLKAGDQILIANTKDTRVMSTERTNTNSKMSYVSIGVGAIEYNCITYLSSRMALFTLEGSQSDGWLLKSGTGEYLYETKTTYYLETINDPTTAKVNIGVEDNNAVITFLNVISNNKLFYYSNGSGEFRCKTGKTITENPVQIYKKVDVLLDGNTTSGTNQSEITSNINLLKSYVVRRTFTADGGWYTLCLPFPLTGDDITNQFKGADFEEFSSVSQDGGSANLKFNKVTETKAGVPYLVKPKNTVENLMFIDKMISVSEPIKVTQNINGKDFSFVGTFDPTTLPVDGSARFIGSSGVELVAPTSNGGDLKGLRAYFLFPSSGAQAKVCHGEIPTSIRFEKVDGQDAAHRIYNLNGQYVGNDQSRLQKGIYVVNGKKVVIK
jgi:hypothetical protein